MLKTITINTDTHKVVPLEPTGKMIDSHFRELDIEAVDVYPHQYELSALCYKAMLAAAPEYTQSPWISTDDHLPYDGQRVFIKTNETHVHAGGKIVNIRSANFYKGKTKEEVELTKSCCFHDQDGNNLKPYAWQEGPLTWFGQTVTHWMPNIEAPEGL